MNEQGLSSESNVVGVESEARPAIDEQFIQDMLAGKVTVGDVRKTVERQVSSIETSVPVAPHDVENSAAVVDEDDGPQEDMEPTMPLEESVENVDEAAEIEADTKIKDGFRQIMDALKLRAEHFSEQHYKVIQKHMQAALTECKSLPGTRSAEEEERISIMTFLVGLANMGINGFEAVFNLVNNEAGR